MSGKLLRTWAGGVAAAILVVGGAGCRNLRSPARSDFAEGYYTSRLYHKKLKKVYVIPTEDSIRIYSAKKIRNGADTAALKLAFPPDRRPQSFEHYTFSRSSADLDVLNILCKFRPSTAGFPQQFNNNILNAALFLGRRTDLYSLRYTRTPLGADRRSLIHYGYSLGVFAGLGGARIDPYVTRNVLDFEYDGVVQVAGVAAIVAVERVNVGLTIGMDHLMDRNHRLWIYQGKPWVGVSIGLNLN